MEELSVKFNQKIDLKGIFYYLNKANGNYGSRYYIDGETYEDENEDPGSASDLDKYYENTEYHFWSSNENPSFSITFDSLFFMTGYGISNRYTFTEGGNSYPSSWSIYGISSNNEAYLLDEQKNQTFCEKYEATCYEENINKYKININSNTQQNKGFKTFIFNQTKRSGNGKYLFLRAFELFGYLCSPNKTCRIIKPTCNKFLFKIPIFIIYFTTIILI